MARKNKTTKIEAPSLWFIRDKKKIYFILAALCFLVYANCLNNGFISDDIPAILENPAIAQTLSYWSDPTTFLNSLVYHLAKFNVVGYHLVSITLHFIDTILVFLFLSLFFKIEASFFAAALFAVHPVHTDAVTWISGRPYLILAFFTLVTYLLYYRANNDEAKGKLSHGWSYALTLAIFTYFIFRNFSFYVFLPIFIMLSDIVFKRWRKTWKLWIPFFVIAALRVILSRAIIHQRINWMISEMGELGARKNPIFCFIYSTFSHLWLLLWPEKLTFYHEPVIFYPLAMTLGIIALVILACFLPLIFKKAKVIFLGMALFVVFLAPTYSPIPVTSIVAERHGYLPSVFFSILTAYFYERYVPRPDGRRRNWLIVLLVCAMMAYGVRTIYRNKDWKDEETLSRATLRTSPGSGSAHNNLGVIYLNAKKNDEAFKEFNLAIVLNSNLDEAYNNRGLVYKERKDLEQAIADYNKALEINPRHANAYYNRGVAYQEKGNFEQAIADYNKALEINPRYIEPYFSRAGIYVAKGDYALAISDYNKAIEINPQYVKGYVYNNLGVVYDKMGEREKAMSAYQQAIAVDPQYANAYYNLGVIYMEMGRKEEAEMFYSKALDLDPNLKRRENPLLEQKVTPPAHTDKPEIKASSTEDYNNLGIQYITSGKYEEAIAAFKKATEMNPKSADAYSNLGNAYGSVGRIDEAIASYEQAIELNPAHAVAHFNLSIAYFDKKQYDLAVSHSDIATRLGYKPPADYLELLKPYRKQTK